MIEGRVFACISVAAGIRTDSLVFPLPHTVLLGFPWGSLLSFNQGAAGRDGKRNDTKKASASKLMISFLLDHFTSLLSTWFSSARWRK